MGASPRLACLVTDAAPSGGRADDEQAAAYEYCVDRFESVDRIEPAALDPGAYDACWWHRTEPVPESGFPGQESIERYVREGGSLLLSLAAMTAVEPLGIDAVGPDAVGWEDVGEPTGPLWKRLSADHPAAEGFETLDVHTRGAGVTAPYARYETVAPASGTVLASTARGDSDLVTQMATVSWRHGSGQVLGVGSALSFLKPTHDVCRSNRERLVANALRFLAAGEPARFTTGPKDESTLSGMREYLSSDHNRPSYHVTPPANWLNDPNGVVQWNGRYHVFYQYNPAGPFHNTIHWGHAVSDDLVHWEDRPVALSPDPDGPDRDGCWSGCTVDDDGVARILYTGGRGEAQLPCLATATDDSLDAWHKDPDNPVIDELPSEPEVLRTEDWDGEFRDHCVWREDGLWHQLIGAGMEGGGGAALLYVSEDLREWEYRGPVLTGDHDTDGTVWECPELLDLGERQLLHVSNYEDVVYFLGEYSDGEFTVDCRDKLDHGSLYAPQSMRTDDGRRLTWGWVPEARDLRAQWDAGWSGTLSLPRELSLAADGRLRQRPVAELTDLRGEGQRVDELRLGDGDRRRLDAGDRRLELRAEIRLGDADAVELGVLETPDDAERTPVRYTRESEVVLDRTAASADPRATTDSQRMTVTPYDDPLSLHVFVDGSVVELFANERHCLTSRVYPTREDAVGVSLAADGGSAVVTDLEWWELGEAW